MFYKGQHWVKGELETFAVLISHEIGGSNPLDPTKIIFLVDRTQFSYNR